MIERYIQAVNTDWPGLEEPAATRARLKDRFPAGAVRRMTQLGLLTGSVLGAMNPTSEDAVVYVSDFGESRALEGYLESFPTPSPTMFQTSIHPSGVQQGYVSRQCSVPEFFPVAGRGCTLGHSLVGALLSTCARVLFCGGEERGTWLRARGIGSEVSYAFAMALTREETAESIGRVRVSEVEAEMFNHVLTLVEWFGLLERRSAYDGYLIPGMRVELSWKPK